MPTVEVVNTCNQGEGSEGIIVMVVYGRGTFSVCFCAVFIKMDGPFGAQSDK